MAHNQILRFKKLKTTADVFEALRHDTRQVQPRNADRKLEVNNMHFMGRYPTCKARYTLLMRKLEKTPRRDAVHGIHVFCGASPDWWKESELLKKLGYIKAAKAWADQKFGADNLISFDVHYDEPGAAPHFTLIYVPIVNGRLNAKSLIGGVRWVLQKLQDDFSKKVGKQFDLERGERREPDDPQVRHIKLKEFKKYMADEKEKLEKDKVEIEKLKSEVIKEKEEIEKLKKAVADDKLKIEAERNALQNNWLGDLLFNLSKEEVVKVWDIAQKKADEFRTLRIKKQEQIPQQEKNKNTGKTSSR